MAKFPITTAADIDDAVPADYWQNLGEIANTYYFNEWVLAGDTT